MPGGGAGGGEGARMGDVGGKGGGTGAGGSRAYGMLKVWVMERPGKSAPRTIVTSSAATSYQPCPYAQHKPSLHVKRCERCTRHRAAQGQ